MAGGVTRGTITLAEAEDEKAIDAPSVVGQGLCQCTIDVDPPDARVTVDVIAGGRYRVTRKSHAGIAIRIAYQIRYGLGGRTRAEA